MIHRCPDELYHLLHETGNIFYLRIDHIGHLNRGKCFIIEHSIVIRKIFHIIHDIISAGAVLICKFPHNRYTVHDLIARLFDLLHSLYDARQIRFDRSRQCTIRLYQMGDRHIGTGITADNNSKLQDTFLACNEIHHSFCQTFIQITRNQYK